MHHHPLTGDQECLLPQRSDSQNLTITPERIKNGKVAALPAMKWNTNLNKQDNRERMREHA